MNTATVSFSAVNYWFKTSWVIHLLCSKNDKSVRALMINRIFFGLYTFLHHFDICIHNQSLNVFSWIYPHAWVCTERLCVIHHIHKWRTSVKQWDQVHASEAYEARKQRKTMKNIGVYLENWTEQNLFSFLAYNYTTAAVSTLVGLSQHEVRLNFSCSANPGNHCPFMTI